MQLQESRQSREFAQWLRTKFTPLLRRRLPEVYYSGFRHSYIPDTINRYKNSYPYILRLDIAKFFPSIVHHHLIVQTQIAYKNLLGIGYVPKSFKKEFLPQAFAFIDQLRIDGIGLPITSAVSKAWSPLLYVSALLELKKRYDLRLLVFVDDFWFMCKDQETTERAYVYMVNYLRAIGHTIHPDKVQSGRVGSQPYYFCGYRLSGGHLNVAEDRVATFKEQIVQAIKTNVEKPLAVLIKLINTKIRGFGHYYKFAKVRRQYEILDGYICKHMYLLYLKNRVSIPKGAYRKFLYSIGLQSLLDIYTRDIKQPLKAFIPTTKKSQSIAVELPWGMGEGLEYLNKLITQQKQIIGLLKEISTKLTV